MAKWYGMIGYAETVETTPGNWDEQLTERPYYGDVIRNTRKLQGAERSMTTSASPMRSALWPTHLPARISTVCATSSSWEQNGRFPMWRSSIPDSS